MRSSLICVREPFALSGRSVRTQPGVFNLGFVK
jgi:hypothetical protein